MGREALKKKGKILSIFDQALSALDYDKKLKKRRENLDKENK